MMHVDVVGAIAVIVIMMMITGFMRVVAPAQNQTDSGNSRQDTLLHRSFDAAGTEFVQRDRMG